MNPTLTTSMQEAWAARRDRALVDLRTAEAAPALVSPAFVERTIGDYRPADVELRRWALEGLR